MKRIYLILLATVSSVLFNSCIFAAIGLVEYFDDDYADDDYYVTCYYDLYVKNNTDNTLLFHSTTEQPNEKVILPNDSVIIYSSFSSDIHTDKKYNSVLEEYYNNYQSKDSAVFQSLGKKENIIYIQNKSDNENKSFFNKNYWNKGSRQLGEGESLNVQLHYPITFTIDKEDLQ